MLGQCSSPYSIPPCISEWRPSTPAPSDEASSPRVRRGEEGREGGKKGGREGEGKREGEREGGGEGGRRESGCTCTLHMEVDIM